ncbi:hypothetical protein [Rhodococcus qingshengii]|uniref:hypothetical protein n=1 Tax=Rhodococcus qingshengii TaxID=334542 RepID=UPI001C5FACE0|nr:hypothetical protein [Rhodococcus qingshengii]MBW4818190.1 hypothetical protein [Rhodococcus qingshengii]
MSKDQTSRRHRPDLTFHPDILGIPAQFRVVDTRAEEAGPDTAGDAVRDIGAQEN